MERQLYRSKTNRMVAGVCGGIAEYFGIDPTIVRLIWVLVTFTYGLGLIAYIIAAIVIPEGGYAGYNGSQANYGSDGFNRPAVDDKKLNLIIGGVLILLGLFAIARRYLHWIDFSLMWPIILIAVGGVIIYNGWRKQK